MVPGTTLVKGYFHPFPYINIIHSKANPSFHLSIIYLSPSQRITQSPLVPPSFLLAALTSSAIKIHDYHIVFKDLFGLPRFRCLSGAIKFVFVYHIHTHTYNEETNIDRD